ncbi:MAG: MBL fold metallo-hydrolase [Bacillota bacterium]|nr:MBL fold metallo-hydrolase [Bacillota bacterium]
MIVPISNRVKFLVSEAGFTYCNCVVIDDEVKTIIDTGAGEKSLNEIQPESFDLVLNTHHHYDHTRGNYLFPQAKVMVHSLDYKPLSSKADFEYYNSFTEWDTLMPNRDYTTSALQMGIVEKDIERNLRATGSLEDGEIIDLGHTRVEVLHTPGHSAGHCCFWFPEEEFLFSGDICLTDAGPWYGEVLSDPGDMIRSINRIIELNPPKMSSCHINEICTDAVPRLTEFRDRIYKREERIYKHLLHTAEDLDALTERKLIYRMHPSEFVVFWEKLMLLKHLNRLIDQGRAEKDENGIFRGL